MKHLFSKIINKVKIAGTRQKRGSTEQIISVPEAIIVNFRSRYPQAKLKKWRNEHDSYVAAFVSRNHRYEAFYNTEGNWMKTEMKIPLTRELPPAISRTLKASEFAMLPIAEIKKIELYDQYVYMIRVENGNTAENGSHKMQLDTLLYFKPDGNLLKIDIHQD